MIRTQRVWGEWKFEKMADNDSFENLLPPSAQDVNSEEGERYSHFRNILMKCTGKCFAPAR